MGFLGQPGGQVQPLPGAVSLDSVLINLNANTNNLQAGQFVSLIKLMPSIALNLTGLMFGIADRQVLLRNMGSVSITLKNADGGSNVLNQFLFGADVVLTAGAYAQLMYSNELLAWTLVNSSAGAAGGGPSLTGNNVWSGTNTFNNTVDANVGALTVNSSFIVGAGIATRLGGAVLLQTAVSPAALAAGSTNDYDTGNTDVSIARLTPDAAAGSTLTGLVNHGTGLQLLLCNIQTGSSGTLTLAHQNAGSTAANRFICPGETDFTILAGQSVLLWYDAFVGRWRVLT